MIKLRHRGLLMFFLGMGLMEPIAVNAADIVLHRFRESARDGAEPYGSLILAPDGRQLFGITAKGGRFGNGIVFGTNRDGSGYTVLHHFTGKKVSYFPSGTLGISPDEITLYGMAHHGDQGIAFRMLVDGSDFTILHEFTGGGLTQVPPLGSLLVSADGKTLYGTCTAGGDHDQGVVFRMSASGANFTLLHSFTKETDGALPYNRLIFSADGKKLFGMTPVGGAYSEMSFSGTIFSIKTDGGGFTVLHHFTGTSDGGKPAGALTLSADGATLYGMSSYGGNDNSEMIFGGVLFSIEVNGSEFTALHHFTGARDDGGRPKGSLTLSEDGQLYGMTQNGGLRNRGTVFCLDADGSDFTLLHSFTKGRTDGAYPNGDVTFSIDHSMLYGMTPYGGRTDDGTIYTVAAVPTPVQPDLIISHPGVDAPHGKTLYQSNAEDQSLATPIAPGGTERFKVQLRNAGNMKDTIELSAAPDADHFSIQYLDGARDVSAKVKAGTYQVTLQPGQKRLLIVKIKAASGLTFAANEDCLITARSQTDPSKVDTVRAFVSVL